MLLRPRRFVWLAVTGVFFCCSPSKCGQSSAPLRLVKSDDIAGDAVFKAALASLERSKSIESSHIGFAAQPSAVYASFEKLRDVASAEQVNALVMHESPVVRGYMAGHALSTLDDAKAVYPLLGDTTRVRRVNGCDMGASSIAELVAEELCRPDVAKPGRHLSLLAGAKDPALIVATRASVLTCLGKANPTEAFAIAKELARSSEPALVVAAISVLGASDQRTELVAPFASSDEAGLRQAAARALYGDFSERALAVLEPLLNDDDFYVRTAAYRAYAGHPLRKEARMVTALEDGKIQRWVASDLAELGGEREIALLGPYFDAHPADFDALSRLASKDSEATTGFMRSVLARHPVVLSNGTVTPRALAIRYLTRTRDAQSLPEIRKSLESWDNAELDAAFSAVAELDDKGAIPFLERLAASKNAIQRERATRALSQLRP